MGDARKITFRSTFSAGKVTASGLNDVSLITGGVEALGHGVFVDDVTLRQVSALLVGKALPAYLTHDGIWRGDRLAQEIGLFSGIVLDGQKVIAGQFYFLDAFKKYEPKTCELLLELARKIPEQFGISIVFEGYAAWVRKDGSEVMDTAAPMPEDAIRTMPSIRVSKVESADFVKNPAANPDGLAALAKKFMADDTKQETVLLSVYNEKVTALQSAVADLEKKLSNKETERLALEKKLTETAEKVTASEGALATAKAENADLRKKLAEAEKMSAEKLGIAPVKFTPSGTEQPVVKMSDREAWDHYAKLAETDAAAAEAFKAKRLTKKK